MQRDAVPQMEKKMSDKFKALANLGAGEFEHLDGSLIEHLNGTKEILARWGGSQMLQDAGLYHAAYGTAGFEESLASTDQREKIAAIIGAEAEEIVYQYCACDRQVFFANLGQSPDPLFKNRFTGESYHLAETMLRDFCELTAANEIEIAIDNPDFIEEHGASLAGIIRDMTPYLSVTAKERGTEVFGACTA